MAEENALDADGERLARKVGKMDRRIKGGKAIFRRYANDGRRWRWLLGRRRRRVELHGDERFFTYKFGGTKKSTSSRSKQNHAQRGESTCCLGMSKNLMSKPP